MNESVLAALEKYGVRAPIYKILYDENTLVYAFNINFPFELEKCINCSSVDGMLVFNIVLYDNPQNELQIAAHDLNARELVRCYGTKDRLNKITIETVQPEGKYVLVFEREL